MTAGEVLSCIPPANRIQLSSYLQTNGDGELILEQDIKLQQVESVYTADNYDNDRVRELLDQFGHKSFRSGQEESIKRILCGECLVSPSGRFNL